MRQPLIIKIIVIVLIFFVVSVIFPENIKIAETSNLLTATTVLFGLLAGFFIASALTNYFRLQSLIAEETADIISLYQRVITLAPRLKKKILAAIDTYVIAAFDYELSVYINKTWPQFNQLLKICQQINSLPRNMLAEDYSELLSLQNDLLKIRQEITLTSRKILGWGHWIFLISLAIVIIFLLFVINDGSLISSLITVLLATATVIIMILLYEIDSNLFAEDELSFTIYQRIFLQLDLLPYYPEDVITKGRLKLQQGKYRIGYYLDYPKSTKKKIKLYIAQ